MRFLFIFLFVCAVPLAEAKVMAHYTYLKAKKPVKKSIQYEEVKRAYEITKESVANDPAPEVFFKEYLRFKMGVEVGLNEKKLVKSPDIENQITDPYLRAAFHDSLYKSLAELKLKKSMEGLDKRSANLSPAFLKKLYAKEPEFNIFFIAIQHPINPTAKQIQEAKTRANKIYSKVIQSKKPFLELVALYSDDKSNGVLGINRSRAVIWPEVYQKLKSMKNNSISRPIRYPHGYMIVKLNQKIPFSSANKVSIKANYFNKERADIFNKYFDGLKKDFKVTIVNRALVKKL